MELAVGVIGTGNIGADHARRLATRVAGARVHAVFDLDGDRAAAIAAEVGAVALRSAEEVVDDAAVDAVLIASPGDTHAALALACIAAAKPVLCEKPLATTTEECWKVVEAEAAHGSRLVQVGFMRRYDAGYLVVKQEIDGGRIGEVLLAHCIHRNQSVPPSFTSDMSLTDSVIHEIDTARWLLTEELVAATVVPVRRSPLAAEGLLDPQLVLLEAASGAVVEVEVFVNCQYGYDVRCEVVGSTGTASLEIPTANVVTTAGARSQPVPVDWRLRFGAAYLEELQHFVDAVRAGGVAGPSSYDGYAATAVAESCVRSLKEGQRAQVTLAKRPALYETA
ncbi:MAG TPA: Gfo/Idh/MocA family oxidoreductase [Acidimicrobiales bacterium]|nr:Gfo/Idh/MocA family oxidoreductase [Acidimicrobiales bacterium]